MTFQLGFEGSVRISGGKVFQIERGWWVQKQKGRKVRRMISHIFRQMGIKEVKLAVLSIYQVLAFSKASG